MISQVVHHTCKHTYRVQNFTHIVDFSKLIAKMSVRQIRLVQINSLMVNRVISSNNCSIIIAKPFIAKLHNHDNYCYNVRSLVDYR